jgi:hypothetical protein
LTTELSGDLVQNVTYGPTATELAGAATPTITHNARGKCRAVRSPTRHSQPQLSVTQGRGFADGLAIRPPSDTTRSQVPCIAPAPPGARSLVSGLLELDSTGTAERKLS